jgi:DNA-directed RNA polymerase specialized sigma24 family protein
MLSLPFGSSSQGSARFDRPGVSPQTYAHPKLPVGDNAVPHVQFRLLVEAVVRSGAVKALLRASHRRCGRWTTLDDFCNDVLIRALQYQASFRGRTEAELMGWLGALGHQLATTIARRGHRSALPVLPVALAVVQETPVYSILRNEAEAWLRHAMKTLRGRDLELSHRHYYRGETFVAIATAWGKRPNTIARRHARVLAKFRAQL